MGCYPPRYVRLSRQCSRFSYVRYVLSSMKTVSIISQDTKITFKFYTHICLYLFTSVLVFHFILISNELHSTCIYSSMCFVHRSILLIQVQVSIKVMFGNQWTQYFRNLFINHLSLTFILFFFVYSSLRDKKMKGTSNSHSPSIFFLSLCNRCQFLVQNNSPIPPFDLDIMHFGRTI